MQQTAFSEIFALNFRFRTGLFLSVDGSASLNDKSLQVNAAQWQCHLASAAAGPSQHTEQADSVFNWGSVLQPHWALTNIFTIRWIPQEPRPVAWMLQAKVIGGEASCWCAHLFCSFSEIPQAKHHRQWQDAHSKCCVLTEARECATSWHIVEVKIYCWGILIDSMTTAANQSKWSNSAWEMDILTWQLIFFDLWRVGKPILRFTRGHISLRM